MAKVSSDSSWTFFTNHGHVLVYLSQHSDATLREVADLVGITERAIHKIVSDLEEAGFVRKRRLGRRNFYDINADIPMRHPLESHCSVSQIMDMIIGSKN